MAHFWVTWHGRNGATVNAKTKDDARSLAKPHGGEVIDVRELPYPRGEQINPGGCPSFCFGGMECLDKTACPRRRSCCE